MPAIAPYIVSVGGAGVLASDIGLKGDEDFLLIHGVEDSADYGNRITKFNAAGDKIYDAIQDPTLIFSFDADCLAFQGLANAHPGQCITASDIINLIPDAFQWEGVSRKYIYMRPRRRRRSAQLASINFDIEVVNESISTQYSLGNNELGKLNWGTPANVYSSTAYPPFMGYSIIWRRTLTPGLTTSGDYGMSANTTFCYQGWPIGNTQPTNLATFYTIVDPLGSGVAGESVISEVYNIVNDATWLAAPSGVTIDSLILSNKNPSTETQVDSTICAQYYALWHLNSDPSGTDRAATYMEEFASLADFKSKYNTGTNGLENQTLKALYDARACVYLQTPIT